MTVRTRFAPSPTGYLHIGGARTALFCWLYSRHHGGTFILRVEDTDRERSTEAAVQAILDGMAWLDLNADEGPFYQTQRFDRYREVARGMLESGTAYHCYCSKEELDAMRAEQMARKEKPRYDGRCRDRKEPKPGVTPVIRFKNPQEGQTVVEDAVKGRVVFDNHELDDLIIVRSDGNPTYNFCVVVDDMDMRITHVIRGDDHLNNTPRQMNILKALGFTPPQYAHLPMILGPDGTKLSKRHGAVSVMQYREDGYLPEAVLNYLVRLGWSHGDQEVFSREEMVKLFDIKDVNTSASAINPQKLLWLNQHYIKTGDLKRLADELKWHLERIGVDMSKGPSLEGLVKAQQERAKTFKEMAEGSRFFFEDVKEYDPQAAAKNLTPEVLPGLMTLREKLVALPEWSAPALHDALNQTAEALGLKLGKLAQPLRVAVSGGGVSPPIDATLELLGRETALARMDRAIKHIEKAA
ncbi:MAG TPA: glutamate--tRNA ligase [Gammaproteobacteria bacterium]|jgi:glutamyl-tRNA synthetase|nr:glutamate--tRNA ligase [Gammaproteobacteria bacterium]